MEPADVLVEFSRLLDSYEISDEEVPQSLIGIVQAMLDESHWRPLEEGALTSLLFEGISLYGQTNWEPLAPVIAPVYLHAMEQVAVDKRLQLQQTVSQKVMANETSLNALMPFLILETELAIVATSAIDFVMIPKPPEDDPIGWPRRLVSDLEARMPANMGAVFGALVNLGDQRVIGLLQEVKWLISDDELGVATKCATGFPCIATLEFWLDWMEELTEAGLQETGLYGECASALVWLTRRMRRETFADSTRNFGYLNIADGFDKPIDVRRQLSVKEVGDEYAERFYALEATESAPRLMSDVLRRFLLEPKAPLEERYTMQ